MSPMLHMTVDSIARSAFTDHRYRKRCWRAAVVTAILAAVCTANAADAPPLLVPEQMNGGEIKLALQKLNVLGRVLYIAAHPDDENTNLMALWANGSLYDSAYLSVTRGDGGQNLLGPELGERLGVTRGQVEILGVRCQVEGLFRKPVVALVPFAQLEAETKAEIARRAAGSRYST